MSPSAPAFDAERLTRLGRVTATALSPDGTWLAVAVSRLDGDEARYVSDLWRVSVTDPLTPPVRLTRGDTRDTQPRFRPDGALAFLSDRPTGARGQNGQSSETRNQVWAFLPAGGEPEPVTDEPLGVTDFRFAASSGQLFVITDVFLGIPHEQQRAHAADLAKRGPSGLHFTRMSVRHWDHWIAPAAPHVITYDVPSGERRDLTPDADREHREVDFGIEWDVSPDGSRVVIAALRPGPMRVPDGALRVIDTATGQCFDMGVMDSVSHVNPLFAPDGNAIACVRWIRKPGQHELVRPWLFDDLGEHAGGHELAPAWDARPHLWAFTPDGRGVIATADHRGEVPVYRLDIRSHEVVRLSAESAGGSHQNIEVSRDGKRVVGVRHRLVHPPEPFRMDLVAGQAPELLASLSGFAAEQGEALATWSSFTVAGEGGAEVQSFLIMPINRNGKCPALVWIHGGPVGQHADCWHWRWNPLVPAAAGYAVILPNPRGSTGFGPDYIQGIWNNQWGAACYRDIMAVTDAVCERADIDPDRVGAMGGSFGGYMANWIGVSTDRFRCIMTHAGIYALAGFSGTTDYPGYMHYEVGVTPYQDLETFERYSPHRLIESWKTPTLIIHGEKDYRVPIGEALQLFEALCWRGVDVELLVFPDENHWILRPQNIRQWYRTVLEFASKHLGPR